MTVERLEQSKWEKELNVFKKLVNTIVLTGNIHDKYPIVDEEAQRFLGFLTLEQYLVRLCRAGGYQYTLCYSPVHGFYAPQSMPENVDALELIEDAAMQERKAAGEATEHTFHLYRTQNPRSLRADCMEDDTRLIQRTLAQTKVSIAFIVHFADRLLARPDDLDTGERMTFLHLQQGAAEAGWLHGQGQSMIQNQLFLLADKINDLPPWYYLTYPGLKNIEIPKPDYHARRQIVRVLSPYFPDYKKAGPSEVRHFQDRLVGLTEGFSSLDMNRVRQIAQDQRIRFQDVDNAVMLYKHGIRENPWTKLDKERLRNAQASIEADVLGQKAAVSLAVDVVKRAAAGMSDIHRSGVSSGPRGVLFLAGPTGTGKTELAKSLTRLIFLDERNMIRFDMSEYREPNSDQRLLGAPPGYVGYEAGGQLTNAVREHPFSVLLFDEIEKAHPSVLDKFLQILEDGRITDGRGETAYFQDCLIIFTSNLGISIPSPNYPGLRIPNVTYEADREYHDVHDKVIRGVRQFFNEELGRPELLNRIGNNILVFDFIREDVLSSILKKQISDLTKRLWERKHICLQVTEDAELDLYGVARDRLPDGQGGRGIRNTVEELLVNPLARMIYDHPIDTQREELVVRHLTLNQMHVAEIDAKIQPLSQSTWEATT